MAPVLSPKKTWEGFAGGLLASVVTAVVAVPLLGLPIDHLMGSEGLRVSRYEVGPALGSGHRALLARVHLVGER